MSKNPSKNPREIPLMRMASAVRVKQVGLRADSTSRRNDCAINACKLREDYYSKYRKQIRDGSNYIIPLEQLEAQRAHQLNCHTHFLNPVYNESCDQVRMAKLPAEDEQKTGGKKKRKQHTRKHKKSNRKSKHHKKSHKGGNKKSNRKTHKRTKHHKKRGHKSRRRR